MKKDLTKTEQKYIDDLLQWMEGENRQQVVFYNICLLVGGMIILFTCIYLLQILEDRSFYWIGVSGFLLAIPFFVVYLFGMKSLHEKNIIASIFGKLKHRHE